MKTKDNTRIIPLLTFIILLIILFGCSKPATEEAQNQSNTVTDKEGNVYKTVTIGTQIWMAENLKVTKYRNGDLIPNVLTTWSKVTNGAFCWYNNDIKNKDIYGALYNWYAIKDSRNIAPLGWHVATNSDWTTLTSFLGGESVAGGKLKETGTSHWVSPNTRATDQYGFKALPGGITYGGNFSDGLGLEGVWWSNITSTPTDYSNDWNRQMWNEEESISKTGYIFDLSRGSSVRCVKDDNIQGSTLPTVNIAAVTNIKTTSVTAGGEVTSDGGSAIIDRGVCWSILTVPTIANSKTTNGTGIGSFVSSISGLNPNTIYRVRAYATNNVGTAYNDNVIDFKTDKGAGTVNDIEGNAYNTITIGTQVWMAENLKVKKLNNSTNIPLVSNNSTWANLTTPGYCWYNNLEALFKDQYGALYNWQTINTNKLCPTGWHVPSNAEWTTLVNYSGGIYQAGGYLKESGINHWQSPNTGANNLSGFTALAGGFREGSGIFKEITTYGVWWNSTGSYVNMTFGFRGVNFSDGSDYKSFGFSVRCIKD